MGSELETAVKRLIQSRNLIPPDVLVIIGVSGGVDSLVLLHILNRIHIRLHAATLDHGLRGEAGAADAQFVEDTTREWNIPCTREFADVPTLAAEWKLGIEAAARRARYDFLKSTADQYGAQHIAVAHNLDDQAETVLMHLIRGSGVRGLGGMALSTMQQGYLIVRPLLETPRAEIEAYAHENGLTPRMDATNEDTHYLRNRIRQELVPLLKTYNPNVVQAIGRLADIVIEDSTSGSTHVPHFDVISNRHDPDNRQEGRMFVGLITFRRWFSRAGKRQALVNAYNRLVFPDTSQITYEHVERALAFTDDANTGDIYQLPGRVQLRIEYESLIMEREDAPPELQRPLLVETYAQSFDHVFRFSQTKHTLVMWDEKPNLPDEIVNRLSIPKDAKLALRARQTGDIFQPLGMGGHTKSVREWMIDHKVPAQYRDRVPLLLVNDQIAAIIWGEQWAIDHRFAVQGISGERVLYFRIERL